MKKMIALCLIVLFSSEVFAGPICNMMGNAKSRREGRQETRQTRRSARHSTVVLQSVVHQSRVVPVVTATPLVVNSRTTTTESFFCPNCRTGRR